MENEVKEPAPIYNYVSPEEYLEMERASKEKHEYYNGEIFAMAGASPQRNDIAFNINRLLASPIHEKGCKLYGSDFRVHIPANTLYTYPDFTIVCGRVETFDAHQDNLLNPNVIIEIVSKSSRSDDRSEKFHLYRSIIQLKEYILIDSTEIRIEVFVRNPDNSWVLNEFSTLADSFSISNVGLTLKVVDVYEDVQFQE